MESEIEASQLTVGQEFQNPFTGIRCKLQDREYLLDGNLKLEFLNMSNNEIGQIVCTPDEMIQPLD